MPRDVGANPAGANLNDAPPPTGIGQRTQVVTLSPVDQRWRALVHSHPRATIAHHPAWSTLLRDTYGYRVFVLGAQDADGALVGGIPLAEVGSLLTGRRWVSLPFIDACPVLCDDDAARAALLEHLDRAVDQGRVSSAKIRDGLPVCPGVNVSDRYLTHILDLEPDPERVYKRFKPTNRNKITQARRHGITTRRDTTLDGIEEFWKLHLETRRRLGVPTQPKRFFQLMWASLIERGLGFVQVAYKDDLPIAAAVFLTFNGTILYKYSASDERSWGYRANNSLLDSVIRWGCEQGYRRFDFGRTDLGHDSLASFKRSWGAREEELVYSTLGPAARTSPGLVSGVLGSDAAAPLRRLSSTIIRRSPTAVGRAVGEVLYRYAAWGITTLDPEIERTGVLLEAALRAV